MKQLFLIGHGGLAREVLGWMKNENSPLLDNFVGFLVTNDVEPDLKIHNYPVLSIDQIETTSPQFDFIPTIGDPHSREKICAQLIEAGGSPVSFISTNVPIGLNVKIGQGTIINPRSSISSDASIGNFALINCNTGIGHDVVIEDYVSILGSCSINGDVKIGRSALIGSGACIHPNKKIGANAKIGIGSVVIRNVKDNVSIFGNPAKKIG